MKLTIDNQTIECSEGVSVLEAARQLNIEIPSMCYHSDYSCHPSCMVCLVKDERTGKFIPSCAMPAEDGMMIDASSIEVKTARRESLELLLSDHLGDCEAPCKLSCPAHMNIPLMNRLIAEGNIQQALAVVREEIALPLTLGYVCQAPCEKACHRKPLGGAVSICHLKRFTALNKEVRSILPKKNDQDNPKRIAIIGTGPAGLSAAFFLQKEGHLCTLFDKNELPGGALRYQTDDSLLPRAMLDADIECITAMGAVLILNTPINDDNFLELKREFDAVIVAVGTIVPPAWTGDHVFVCRNQGVNLHMAVRSASQGKLIAREVIAFFCQHESMQKHIKFNSHAGPLTPSDLKEYLKESREGDRIIPASGEMVGLSLEEARQEAFRCMHCDCRKLDNCKLRIYSDIYQADKKHFKGLGRKNITKSIQHDFVVYESQKCIRCGLCVQISEKDRDALGMTYVGRGFHVEIQVPFGKEMDMALKQKADECIEFCPTGALGRK